MKVHAEGKWIVLLICFLVFSSFVISATSEGASKKRVGTAVCVDCHQDWPDNNPPADDVARGNASLGYTPLNLMGIVWAGPNPFYSIPDGYGGSIHVTGGVNCEDCHGGGIAHFGLGPIPNPIPNTTKCAQCHPDVFEEFVGTAHPNSNNQPGRFFDQKRNGKAQAVTTFPDLGAKYALFQEDQSTIVRRNQRIEECSVCHQYSLEYPQFVNKIAQGTMPKRPEVGCPACHDSHIPAPNGRDPARVTNTVQVTSASTSASGTTVLAATPVEGREVSYLNHKPYKIDETGAQNLKDGVWTRGSTIARPSITIVKDIGILSTSGAISNRLTFPLGGFPGKVKPFNTLFISGEATATVNLPADAVNAGAPVTVKAILDRAGFEVEEVLSDTTLAIAPRTDSDAVTQLGTDQIAVVAKATVTYKKTTGKPGTLSVFVPFTGSFAFEIRDMYTNMQNLCGSCHTQGKYKFTAWGKRKDRGVSSSSDGGGLINLSATHNLDIGGQYRTSGHAAFLDPPFEEFSAFPYGTGHQSVYPVDMSITMSGDVGSLRNNGNTNFQLTQTPNATNAYLSVAGNTFLPTFNNNFACFQCHNGLATLDYLDDVQGTPDASVVWGDATVTCITCHDPHDIGAGDNVRIPTKLSYSSRFVTTDNPRGGINKFMDGTDIPSNVGTGIICLFCHQGRESGLTVFIAINAANPCYNPYTTPGAVISPSGINFINSHYLDGGSILWSRNAWEYFFDGVPQTYSTGVTPHQDLNCAGCHMAQVEDEVEAGRGKLKEDGELEGGHTWRPPVQVCQQCHGDISSPRDIPAIFNYDGNSETTTTFEKIGAVVVITNPATDTGGTGLVGKLNRALADRGIFYNPDSNPYFFTAPGGTTRFSAFTANTLSAAFNLQWAWKAGENCLYVHNAFYIAQILQDSLRALGALPPAAERPTDIFGERPATDYREQVSELSLPLLPCVTSE